MESLGGAVGSVGMSESEFLTLARTLMPNLEGDIGAGMVAFGECFGFERVCIHADHWAASATLGDPVVEREALMLGCLLSSVRAAAGRPVRPQSIAARAEFHQPPFPDPVGSGRWTLVSCASPYLARPETTLGLGDSFTAGCLLALGYGVAGAAPVQIAHGKQY